MENEEKKENTENDTIYICPKCGGQRMRLMPSGKIYCPNCDESPEYKDGVIY